MRNKYICLLCFCLLSPFVGAQTQEIFIDIKAADHPILSNELPLFTTQKLLGETNIEQVRFELEFPEKQPLSRDEIKKLQAQGFAAPEKPIIHIEKGISRKQCVADISFVPIVKTKRKWYRITSVKIAEERIQSPSRHIAAFGLHAQSASDRYADRSVLSSGKWVKIRVEKEGIYELTQSKLKEMGFADISRVKVYGYGGRILPQKLSFAGDEAFIDDLNEIPLYRKSGSLLFFAEGTVRWENGVHKNNHYSLYSYYFVTEGDHPAELQTITATSSATTPITQVEYATVLDNDAFAWYEGGSEMYDFYDFYNGNQHAFKLNTPGVVSGSEASVSVAFSAASTLSSTAATISLNGSSLGRLTVSAYNSDTESAREARTSFQTADLQEENTFSFTTTAGNHARLNFIRATYQRKLDAAATPYAFSAGNTHEAATLQIANAGANTQLWQIGNAATATHVIASSLSGTTLTATVDDAAQRFVIVDVSKTYEAPFVVGEVENQNLHGDTAQDMVIIIPASGKLQSEAERLAELHRYEGLRTKVVKADAIYNEFSSGTPDATAYRRYLKMLYDRAETEADMPRYLLLFGDCAWDNRMISSDWSKEKPEDYLLAFEVSQTAYSNNSIGTLYSYVTDDYFGLLDDGEGESIATSDKVDIGIGRFLCHDAATAKILVDKVIDYTQNIQVGAWKNRIIMMADNGDANLHMRDCESVVSNIEQTTASRFDIKKVYWDAYTYTTSATGNTFPSVSKALRQDIKEGALMFNYTGHGSPSLISHCHLLKTEDYETATDGNMPLWVFASCEITPYDSPDNNIGRAALYNRNKGAVAVVCASRSVFANYNKAINLAFCQYALGLNTDGSRNTLGDAMRRTKVAMISNGSDRTMNKLKYVLLGDPALPLLYPTGTAVLDSINGQLLGKNDFVQLRAGQQVRFSGHILTQEGNEDHDFQGIVTATLYDREVTVVCKNNDGSADSPMQYQDRPNKLFSGSDSVRNGRFSFVTTIPRDISYSTDAGRLSIYAVNDTRSLECHGYNEQFCLNGTETAEKTDSIGPDIYVWLGNPDFPNGGFVSSTTLFGATLSDSAGINTSGISIGHDIELVLDDATAFPTVLNSYFAYDFGSTTTGTLRYELSNLTYGKHSLTLRAWDLNENSGTARLDFFVTDNVPNIYEVNATDNPARSRTTFITTLENGEETAITTEVYDTMGRLIWKQQGNSSTTYYCAEWNLTDNNGRTVDPGIYIYRSIVTDSTGKHETKAKKMIVTKQ